MNWETRADNNAMYVLYMFAMGLVVPLLVIVGSYASILRVVKKVRRTENTDRPPSSRAERAKCRGVDRLPHFFDPSHVRVKFHQNSP